MTDRKETSNVLRRKLESSYDANYRAERPANVDGTPPKHQAALWPNPLNGEKRNRM
jgi:hypothetical protein